MVRRPLGGTVGVGRDGRGWEVLPEEWEVFLEV